MRILLCGSAGQLGRAIRSTMASHEIVARDLELDICEIAALRDELATSSPDLVINAAAYTDVDGAEHDAEGAFQVNAVGPRNLALVTAERGIPIAQVSTDYVFDGEKGSPYHEFDQPAPRSVYARSKLAGEEAVRSFNHRHYVARTAWLYGTEGRNFALTMRSLAGRPEVRVVDDQLGSPTYAPHLALALERLVESGVFGTYHLAGRGVTSWYEFARRLYRELGVATPVRPVPTSAFPRDAERPRFSALTSLQRPRFELPEWPEGVREWAAALRAREDAA